MRPELPLGMSIERLVDVTDFGSVEVDHSSDATYSVDGSGRKWVRKRMLTTGFQPILAEALGWLIGRELGVPIPGGAVCGAGDDLSWLSEFVRESVHWDPSRAHFVRNVDGLGAMLTLDAVLFNEDRHRKNLLLVPSPGEDQLEAWAIDCGQALVGFLSDFEQLGLKVPSGRNVARGLPLPLLLDGALEAAARSAKLASTERLRTYVREACEIVQEDAVDRIWRSLARRLERANDLVREYMRGLEELP